MTKRKSPGLDEVKKSQILGLVSLGCSRRVAASFVGCSPSTIWRAALRDPAFAERLRHASIGAQLTYLKRIQKAAEKEQYWKAAAWALERLNPNDFAMAKPEMVSVAQVRQMMIRLAQVVVAEIPRAKDRKRILDRIRQLSSEIQNVPAK